MIRKNGRKLAEKSLDPARRLCYTSFYLSAGRAVFARSNARKRRGTFREATGRLCGQYYKEVPIKMAVGARVKVTLRCSECKERNYFTVKNKKNTPDRLEMKKYCPRCRKYTVHNETK